MRLEKIKLAGFKSFVDPTTVPMPSNLVGVVGPNGCGKSNVIDAVRWVMGESSAKMLRGESMADVIFNGSSTRKPVGTAMVELLFDNSDGGAGGKYAQYNHISVKRQVSRDGQSVYFLNNVRCRRRDITDLFLGTGLGPRSYAIIEQGMISRLIEARPEELRVFLEEAAGISKYKERRKETENRISRTRENLDRLNDLRDEIAKQLQHLKRQANAAERYKEFRKEERQLKAELQALKWHTLDQDIKSRDRNIAELQTALEAAIANQRKIEAQIEHDREQHIEVNDQFNQVQGRFYAVGADIARLEQTIQYAQDTRRQQALDLAEAEKAWQDAENHQGEDSGLLATTLSSLTEKEPLMIAAQAAEAAANSQQAQSEKQMSDWQSEWDNFNQQATKPAETAQVERTRINHLEQQEQNLQRQADRLVTELEKLQDAGLEDEIKTLSERETEATQLAADHQASLEGVQENIQALREKNNQTVAQLDEIRVALQAAKGRLASLEALQQSALGQQKSDVTQWLAQQDLNQASRLAQDLQVEDRWQRAVEVVLGYRLQGLCVDGLDKLAAQASSFRKGTLTVFDTSLAAHVSPTVDTLAAKVKSSIPLNDLLGNIRLASDVSQALSMRKQLAEHESVITPEGIWLGAGWMRLTGEGEETAGVLARAEELKQLHAQSSELTQKAESLSELVEQGKNSLNVTEQERDQQQAKLNQVNRELADIRAKLTGKRTRLEHMMHRAEGLRNEQKEIVLQQEANKETAQETRGRLHAALEEIDTLAGRREALIAQRDTFREQLTQARSQWNEQRSLVQQLVINVESMRSARKSLEQNLGRMKGQLEHLARRKADLKESVENARQPLEEQQQELEQRLAARVQVEKELGEARKSLEDLDAALRQLEQDRHKAEQKVQTQREQTDQGRLQRQEILVRGKTIEEQLRELGFEAETLYQELDEVASEVDWQQQVDKLVTRIQRLGAINLAAIDEFKEQSERMDYLDAQHADVSSALDTLENAIRKIDRETRTRFKETYDKVNTGLQVMFPKLFGGGHAYLELTGEDLLDTGVSVMARPPGKRNANIHQLSGGEKALTAVALVFSIFQLNPAPFCMLDEVDAPLDDANVGRFCELVKSMSEKVQFIFITHNKVTMEIANQLAGVTMHEPGVSRLVSVDVQAAADMIGV